MKANEIMKGGKYIAKVSGVLTTVRVDEIREVGRFGGTGYDGRSKWVDKVVYDVTNLKTGRKTTFKSAAKFRKLVRSAEDDRLVQAAKVAAEAKRIESEASRMSEQHETFYDRHPVAENLPSDLEGLTQALSEGL